MPSDTDDPVEQLTCGLTYQRLANGINKYVVTDMFPETVDKMVEKGTALDREAYAAGHHVRSLVIMRTQLITSYLTVRAIESSHNTPPGLRESFAIVGDNLVSILIRHLIFRRATSKTSQVTRFFKTEADALAWLEARRLELGD